MADYALINDGTGAVFYRPTAAFITPDTRSRDWNAYLTWIADANTPDADIRTVAGARDQAAGAVHLEAEVELNKWRDSGTGHPFTAWNAENVRRESVAADAQGTPWAAGYPFLEAQVGIHGADVGAVATYWLGVYTAYEAQAALIEGTREQALSDVAGAASAAAVDVVVAALSWPNHPRLQTVAMTLTPAELTVALAALITLTPGPAVFTLTQSDVAISIA